MNIPLDQTQPNKATALHRGWLVIGVFVLLALILGALFKRSFPLTSLGMLLLWAAAILAFLAPVMALAIWRGKPDGWQDIGLALGVWFMNLSCMLLMSRLPIFSSLEWNWTGKGFAILASLAFLVVWRGISWREVGFAGLRKGSWLPFLVVALVLTPLGSQAEAGPVKTETLLFQLIMPGIDEELVYRGILLALLNRAFGRPWKVLGASVGWGWILSSVLFGLMHGVGFNHSQFVFSIFPIIFTGIGALMLGWLRERTGSLYPAIVVHSLGDSTSYVINALVNGLA